jgi:hypothetical protein
MKPQLVVTDMSGHHAQNMPETVDRLKRGGSWKKQRVIVVIPSADMVSAKCALSWWNMAFPPNNGVVKIVSLGDEVGVAYSNAIEAILSNNPQDPNGLANWEYLLTVEHDNVVPADGLIRLIERMEQHPEIAVMGSLYFTKGACGVAQIWGDIRDPVPNYRPQLPDPNGGMIETYGCGMGMTLFRLAMFKDERIKRPWFRTLNGKDGTGVGTQDLVFAGEARKAGYRFAVDCSVKTGHHDLRGDFGPPDMVW